MSKKYDAIKNQISNGISRQQAEEAIKTILLWIGENPNREGLMNTPRRVIDSYLEMLSGYNVDPEHILSTTFSEIEGYEDIIILSNISIESHCEHHIAPIIGKAHVGYIPNCKVVGISKIARLVEIYAHRLQLQERLTSQIAQAIWDHLHPYGVAVMIEAKHHCMCYRGIKHRDTVMYTSHFMGTFKSDLNMKQRFLEKIK